MTVHDIEQTIKDNKGKEIISIYIDYEYLTLYHRKNGEKYYDTYGITADTFLSIEKWLNQNGYEFIGFEK